MKRFKSKAPLNFKIEVTNLDNIIEKTEEALDTLRKAKSQIDELASLEIKLEIKTSE